MSIIFTLDDAVLNEINIVLDEELSPENTSLDTINHIVLKINEVVKNSGLHGLTRICLETIPDEKTSIRGKQNSVSGSRQNVKRKESLF